MGNRTSEKKVNACGKVAEWNRYVYNDSNQLVSESSYDGKRVTCIKYLYDADGNRTAEITKAGYKKEKVTYEYGVENRLEAVYEGGRLLCAMAYDGDGNRVFQLNYNLHTDEEWKCHYGSGCEKDHDGDSCGSDKNGNDKDNCEPESDKDCRESSADSGENSTYCLIGREEKAEEKEDAYRCGIHFPVNAKVSQTERELISKVKNCGKQNYELIEYINDVNSEYTEVLVEQNIFGKTDTSYVYGVERLSLDRYNGCSGYYLYDPRGSVTGITNERGQLYQSYRYDANGGISFGAPTYENEYTYNGESYNPNIESQYLRARYYDVVTAVFYTEDTYLGNIIEPLTLNRYNYCGSNSINRVDPSGNFFTPETALDVLSLADSFTQVVLNPTSIWNWGMLVWDVISVAVPVLPGSYAGKAAKVVVRETTQAVAKETVQAVVKETTQEAIEVTTKTVAEVVTNTDTTVEVIKKIDELAPTVSQWGDEAATWSDEVLEGSQKYISEQADEAAAFSKNNACEGLDDVNNAPNSANSSANGNVNKVTSAQQYAEKISSSTKVSGKYPESASASEILRNELYDAGVSNPPYKNAAHHIVPWNDPRAVEARDILEEFGIEYNSAANGVFCQWKVVNMLEMQFNISEIMVQNILN